MVVEEYVSPWMRRMKKTNKRLEVFSSDYAALENEKITHEMLHLSSDDQVLTVYVQCC